MTVVSKIGLQPKQILLKQLQNQEQQKSPLMRAFFLAQALAKHHTSIIFRPVAPGKVFRLLPTAAV